MPTARHSRRSRGKTYSDADCLRARMPERCCRKRCAVQASGTTPAFTQITVAVTSAPTTASDVSRTSCGNSAEGQASGWNGRRHHGVHDARLVCIACAGRSGRRWHAAHSVCWGFGWQQRNRRRCQRCAHAHQCPTAQRRCYHPSLAMQWAALEV